jgi:hypothetical protein
MYGLQCPASADEAFRTNYARTQAKGLDLTRQARACDTTTGAEITVLCLICWFWLRRSQLSLLPEQPLLFAVPVAGLFSLALIVQLLSSGQRDLDLRPALLVEINF